MTVFMLGFGPVSRGSVLMLCIAALFPGGKRLRMLNLMNGFFTGIIPKDWSSRKPRT